MESTPGKLFIGPTQCRSPCISAQDTCMVIHFGSLCSLKSPEFHGIPLIVTPVLLPPCRRFNFLKDVGPSKSQTNNSECSCGRWSHRLKVASNCYTNIQ